MADPPADRPPVTLECPSDANATAHRLCALLAAQLVGQGFALQDGAATRLRLQVRLPAGNVLFALLQIDADGVRRSSPELELSVVDRSDIPEAALDRFAAQLLMLAPL